MNLIEGLQEEMNRVREIIKEYDNLPGSTGFFAASLMENSIKEAEKTIANGDTVGMLSAYQDLKEYEL